VTPPDLREGPSFQLPQGALTAFKEALATMSSVLSAGLLPLLGPAPAQHAGELELRDIWHKITFHISALAEGALGSDVINGTGAVYMATQELMAAARAACDEPGSIQEIVKAASEGLVAKVAAVAQAAAQAEAANNGSNGQGGHQGEAADRGGDGAGGGAAQPAGRATRRTKRAKQESVVATAAPHQQDGTA
jgi:hypothetical protein